MSKNTSIYICRDCGYESGVWEGQCRSCGAWNTLEERSLEVVSNVGHSGVAVLEKKRIKDFNVRDLSRISSNISELDRSLGGGMVPGQTILMSGMPGVGKSTLLLQLAASFKGSVLYASGEESESQVVLRAKRLGISSDSIEIVSSTNIDSILASWNHSLLIIDSIQVMMTPALRSQVGSISQVKECSNRIISMAKQKNVPVVIVGHITKGGDIAGPKVLEHLVDTVLYLEGDKARNVRLLRVQKNRFGSAAETGLFTMTELGLSSVGDPSELFATSRFNKIPGTATGAVLEGTRPLTVEIQALSVKTSFGYPKRASSGFSLTRLQLLCAVIQKHLKLNLLTDDVYLNVVSGLFLKDPAVDLAVVAAIVSSYKDMYLPDNSVFVGEVGLGGEIRGVVDQQRRIDNLRGLGYEHFYTSDNCKYISDMLKIFNKFS